MLKKAFKLPIQTVTFVPSTYKKKKKISRLALQKRVKETRLFLSKLFGGYTSARAVGGYILKKEKGKKKLIKEAVVRVTSYATKSAYKKNKKKWLLWCKKMKTQWGQESIGIIIENDMYNI